MDARKRSGSRAKAKPAPGISKKALIAEIKKLAASLARADPNYTGPLVPRSFAGARIELAVGNDPKLQKKAFEVAKAVVRKELLGAFIEVRVDERLGAKEWKVA